MDAESRAANKLGRRWLRKLRRRKSEASPLDRETCTADFARDELDAVAGSRHKKEARSQHSPATAAPSNATDDVTAKSKQTPAAAKHRSITVKRYSPLEPIQSPQPTFVKHRALAPAPPLAVFGSSEDITSFSPERVTSARSMTTSRSMPLTSLNRKLSVFRAKEEEEETRPNIEARPVSWKRNLPTTLQGCLASVPLLPFQTRQTGRRQMNQSKSLNDVLASDVNREMRCVTSSPSDRVARKIFTRQASEECGHSSKPLPAQVKKTISLTLAARDNNSDCARSAFPCAHSPGQQVSRSAQLRASRKQRGEAGVCAKSEQHLLTAEGDETQHPANCDSIASKQVSASKSVECLDSLPVRRLPRPIERATVRNGRYVSLQRTCSRENRVTSARSSQRGRMMTSSGVNNTQTMDMKKKRDQCEADSSRDRSCDVTSSVATSSSFGGSSALSDDLVSEILADLRAKNICDLASVRQLDAPHAQVVVTSHPPIVTSAQTQLQRAASDGKSSTIGDFDSTRFDYVNDESETTETRSDRASNRATASADVTPDPCSACDANATQSVSDVTFCPISPVRFVQRRTLQQILDEQASRRAMASSCDVTQTNVCRLVGCAFKGERPLLQQMQLELDSGDNLCKDSHPINGRSASGKQEGCSTPSVLGDRESSRSAAHSSAQQSRICTLKPCSDHDANPEPNSVEPCESDSGINQANTTPALNYSCAPQVGQVRAEASGGGLTGGCVANLENGSCKGLGGGLVVSVSSVSSRKSSAWLRGCSSDGASHEKSISSQTYINDVRRVPSTHTVPFIRVCSSSHRP